MAKTTTTGASSAEQFIDVLPLALTGEFHKTQLRQLSNLRTCRVVLNRSGEVLQQLQLITTRLHINEVDDDHTADIAQLQLPCNFNSSLTIGPKNRLASIR